MDKEVHHHWYHQTDPRDYVFPVTEVMREIPLEGITPSHRLVAALKTIEPKISSKGFRRAVLDAIFDDGLRQHYPEQPHRDILLARALRRFGKAKCKKLLIERCEILHTWKHRDGGFVPDAYLLDSEKKTVVCYEVEDRHPLNPSSIGEYGAAWWTLEYIYWDLHLIAYDPYGNPRIISFPESDFLARELRNLRRTRDSDG